MNAVDGLEQFQSPVAGHEHIRHDEVEGLAVERDQGLVPVAGDGHPVALFLEDFPQEVAHLRIVFDDQEMLARAFHGQHTVLGSTPSHLKFCIPSAMDGWGGLMTDRHRPKRDRHLNANSDIGFGSGGGAMGRKAARQAGAPRVWTSECRSSVGG